jgi:hypothetical protein
MPRNGPETYVRQGRIGDTQLEAGEENRPAVATVPFPTEESQEVTLYAMLLGLRRTRDTRRGTRSAENGHLLQPNALAVGEAGGLLRDAA